MKIFCPTKFIYFHGIERDSFICTKYTTAVSVHNSKLVTG